jgi:hypothetical protein
MSIMMVVYVAGPYRAATEWQVLLNIRRAEEVALQVWRSGAACICPHKNTAFFGGAAEDSVWLVGDLEIVRRCDAVVCVEGWQLSRGAIGEVALARQLGIPVFERFEEYEQWLSQASARGDGGSCPNRRRTTTH